MSEKSYKQKYFKYKFKYFKQNGGRELNLDKNKKNFLIVLGPTGSGKSKLLQNVVEYLKSEFDIGDISTYKKTLIDDIIEKNKTYKYITNKIINEIIINEYSTGEIFLEYLKQIKLQDVNNYFNESLSNNYKEDQQKFFENKEKIIPILNKPSEQLIDLFNKAYFHVRKAGELCEDEIGKTNIKCDDLNDRLLKIFLKNKENVLFETQGEKSLDWLFGKDFVNENEYNIIFAYSDVQYDKLKQRNTSRAGEQFEEYIKNMSKNTTLRLPELKDEIFCNKINTIKDNLITLIKKNDKRILIFDNNDKDMKIKYDNSPPPPQMCFDFLIKDRCKIPTH